MGDSITWEFYEDEAGEHRCRTRAANGNILMVSGEGYADKRDAEKCARRHGWVEADPVDTNDGEPG